MAKTDINENIYRAIDTIIDARLQNVNFNSTVLCTIVDDSKAASGIFTVDNAGIKFQATSMDKSFKVNDQVYVTVPNNNFDAQKIIIGKKEDFAKLQEQWKDPFSYLDIKYKFDDNSETVEIAPTGDGTASTQMVKRIVLNDDFFNLVNATTIENGQQYFTREDAYKDLLSSGWDFYKKDDPVFWGQSLQGVNELKWKAVLRRVYEPESGPSTVLYRIKNLGFNKVPYRQDGRGLCQPQYTNTIDDDPYGVQRKYCFLGDDQTWIDDSVLLRFYEKDYTDLEKTFYVFQNVKQYRPIPLSNLKNIIITADIKSDLMPKENITSGTYNVLCKLYMIHQNDSNTSLTLELPMSSDQDFIGDPYNYFDYFTQQVMFDITTQYQNYIINKIEFFITQNGDFVNAEGNSKIIIKNPKIYFGLPIQETTIGYKSYASMFEQSHEYYQKTTPTKLIYLQACLEDIPPTNSGLETDGPFNMTITTYPKTTDTTIVPDRTYYKIMYGSYEPVENPKETELSQYYVQVENSVLRYKPKIYIKNEDNEFVEDPDIKYFDQIYKTSNYDWDNNLYSWDAAKKQWYIKADDSPQNPAPRRDFYVCFPKNRKMSMYMGTVDSNDKEIPPQVGIASDDNNVDVVLAAGARDSNVLVSTADRNSKISIQAADKSSMELTNEAITLAVNGAALELTKAKLEALIALLDNN